MFLSDVLNSWITARESMRARAAQNGATPTIAFVKTVEQHADSLGRLLEDANTATLNLAQLEALHELTGTLLGRRRLGLQAFTKS